MDCLIFLAETVLYFKEFQISGILQVKFSGVIARVLIIE